MVGTPPQPFRTATEAEATKSETLPDRTSGQNRPEVGFRRSSQLRLTFPCRMNRTKGRQPPFLKSSVGGKDTVGNARRETEFVMMCIGQQNSFIPFSHNAGQLEDRLQLIDSFQQPESVSVSAAADERFVNYCPQSNEA